MDDITFEIAEHPVPNTHIGNLFNALSDKVVVRSIRVDAVNQKLLQWFRIDRDSGNIYTTSEAQQGLDREILCPKSPALQTSTTPCVLTLILSINNRFLTKINFHLQDVNDNPPVFSKLNQGGDLPEYTFLETSIPGEEKRELTTAHDADAESRIFYYLSPETGTFKLAEQLDSNTRTRKPFLILNEKINYEKQKVYRYTLVACDEDKFKVRQPDIHCTQQPMVVKVLNVNDEMPVFKQTRYSAMIEETVPIGHEILRVKASDADDPPYNDIFYGIKATVGRKQDYFGIDCKTGSIRLIKPLPKPGTYQFNATASNNGCNDSDVSNQVALTTVFIHVTDTNNHAPEITFYNSSEIGNLAHKCPETMPNPCLIFEENIKPPGFLAYFLVTDLDVQNNGITQCHLDTSSHSTVDNSVIEYFDLELVSKLADQKILYRLVLKKSLDAETLSDSMDHKTKDENYNWNRIAVYMNLKIVCVDGGTPPLKTSLSISVGVADVDEFPPKVSLEPIGHEHLILKPTKTIDSYILILEENITVPQDILQISVTDMDVFSQPVFRLSSPLNRFRVDELGGTLILIKTYDYEKIKEDYLEIVIHEYGGHEVRASVKIHIVVQDINDNVPQFVSPPLVHFRVHPEPEFRNDGQPNYEGMRIVEIEEEQSLGSRIAQIRVFDADSGKNANISLSILEITAQPFSDGFTQHTVTSVVVKPPSLSIDEDGFLLVRGRLNREDHVFLDVLIQANDMGHPPLTARTIIRIVLVDINDNTPFWQFPTANDHMVQVKMSSVTTNTVVTRIHAYDVDEPKTNGKVVYGLVEPEAGHSSSYSDLELSYILAKYLIEIGRETGEVKISASIRNMPDGFLDVWVTASDCGALPKKNTSRLTLYITSDDNLIDSERMYRLFEEPSTHLTTVLRNNPMLDISRFLITLNETRKNLDQTDDQTFPKLRNLSVLSIVITSSVILLSIILVLLIIFYIKYRKNHAENTRVDGLSDKTGHSRTHTLRCNESNGNIRSKWKSHHSDQHEFGKVTESLQGLTQCREMSDLQSTGAPVQLIYKTLPMQKHGRNHTEESLASTSTYFSLTESSIPVQLIPLTSNVFVSSSSSTKPVSQHNSSAETIPSVLTTFIPVTPVQLIPDSSQIKYSSPCYDQNLSKDNCTPRA